MVLVGQVQRELVSLINAHGPHAVGVSGEDAHLLTAAARSDELGLVGEITEVRPEFVHTLLEDDLIPIVSTVSRSDDGRTFNVNADSAAAALAVALGAVKLVVLTDVAGLYRDWPTCEDFVHQITPDELRSMPRSWIPGCCRRWKPAWPRWMAGCDGPMWWTAGSRTVCWSRSSPIPGGDNGGGPIMNTTAMLTRRWQTVMSDNYGTPPVAIVRGQGALVWDADGKQYLDMVAGIAVNAIGHAHPAIQAAVASNSATTATSATWRCTRWASNWQSD